MHACIANKVGKCACAHADIDIAYTALTASAAFGHSWLQIVAIIIMVRFLQLRARSQKRTSFYFHMFRAVCMMQVPCQYHVVQTNITSVMLGAQSSHDHFVHKQMHAWFTPSVILLIT